jgi:hypothetical protein
MTDALAGVAIGRDAASRGGRRHGEQPLKNRVCRYFSSTGIYFYFLDNIFIRWRTPCYASYEYADRRVVQHALPIS